MAMTDEQEQQLNHALAIQLNRRKELSDQNVQRMFTRKGLEQGMLECFELVGGIPRLAIWANDPENYGEFLKLLSKLFPKEMQREAGQVINFVSSVPDSPLNTPQPDTAIDRIDYDEAEDG